MSENKKKLLLTHRNELSDLILWKAFIHIDDNPVKIISISEMGNQPQVVFFDDALPAGDHNISFELKFKEKDKQEEDDPTWKVEANFNFSINPKTKEKKVIRLITSREGSEGIRTRWVYKKT